MAAVMMMMMIMMIMMMSVKEEESMKARRGRRGCVQITRCSAKCTPTRENQRAASRATAPDDNTVIDRYDGVARALAMYNR
jgi:hypothetical protein